MTAFRAILAYAAETFREERFHFLPRPNPGMTERYLGRAREHAQEAQQEPASHDHVKLRVTAKAG
jgi:hypothetical protein